MDKELALRTFGYLIGHYKTHNETIINSQEIEAIEFMLKNNEDLEQQVKKQKEVIDKAIKYIKSYSSIHTIQFGTENDSLNDIELNKTLDEKTMTEMTNRYLLVHDKLLEILEDKEV